MVAGSLLHVVLALPVPLTLKRPAAVSPHTREESPGHGVVHAALPPAAGTNALRACAHTHVLCCTTAF